METDGKRNSLVSSLFASSALSVVQFGCGFAALGNPWLIFQIFLVRICARHPYWSWRFDRIRSRKCLARSGARGGSSLPESVAKRPETEGVDLGFRFPDRLGTGLADGGCGGASCWREHRFRPVDGGAKAAHQEEPDQKHAIADGGPDPFQRNRRALSEDLSCGFRHRLLWGEGRCLAG